MPFLDEFKSSPLPTHIDLVVRRLRVVGADASADTFLHTSYLAESVIKTLAVSLHAGMRDAAPDLSYRIAYELLRADGLGTWDRAIREMTSAPASAYLPKEFRDVLAWATKKRTKPEDGWFAGVRTAAGFVLEALGSDVPDLKNQLTVRELITLLVQIRNKTKAHGAVGQDFFEQANPHYVNAVVGFSTNCPLLSWRWLQLIPNESKKDIRAVHLVGAHPEHLGEKERPNVAPERPGVYVGPVGSTQLFFCGELLRSNKECSAFFLPNGGASASQEAEFIDYATGSMQSQDIRAYQRVPAPLPPSETEGLSAIDVQSNVFGNLPTLARGYVERPKLQEELRLRLEDHNHHIITLHGAGGVGKTSLALFIAHEFAERKTPPFEHIVWLSARDIDLRPAGPSAVKPGVVDVEQVAKAYGRLFAAPTTVEHLASALQAPTGKFGTLFIFDNFETMRDVPGLYVFLDTHTHLPNKVLITSRERQFKADYPIEVRGLERAEAEKMIASYARELGIAGLITSPVVSSLYDYASGHAYLLRVMLGEIAKERRFISPPQVLGRRTDVADAVFERSFNKLSDNGRAVFLTVAGWRTSVPEIALLVVVAQRGVDVEEGVDECQRLALLHIDELEDGQRLLSMPFITRKYGERKLQGDPDKLTIEADLQTIQRFGALSGTTPSSSASEKQIERFIAWAHSVARGGVPAEISAANRALEMLALHRPSAWIHLGRFREAANYPLVDTAYAYRRAVEAEPHRKESWLARADFAERSRDDDTRISSLVAAVEADPSDIGNIREVAYQLCQFINDRAAAIPRTRRGVYLASVRAHMTRIAPKLDATGLSRLAWLYLLENDAVNAHRFAEMGLTKEPGNEHCARIVRRVEQSDLTPA